MHLDLSIFRCIFECNFDRKLNAYDINLWIHQNKSFLLSQGYHVLRNWDNSDGLDNLRQLYYGLYTAYIRPLYGLYKTITIPIHGNYSAFIIQLYGHYATIIRPYDIFILCIYIMQLSFNKYWESGNTNFYNWNIKQSYRN